MKILVGTIALRGPDGEFLPSVPIYQNSATEENAPQELTAAEKTACNELAKKMAKIFKPRSGKA